MSVWCYLGPWFSPCCSCTLRPVSNVCLDAAAKVFVPAADAGLHTHVAQVDLKDKWRNLMRLAVLPAAALRTRCAKRRELPLDLLVKVCPTSSA